MRRILPHTPKKVRNSATNNSFVLNSPCDIAFHIVGAVGLAAVVVAFYKFAPAQGEDNFITRTLASYSTPAEIWEQANLKHAWLSQEASEHQHTIALARQPEVHRYSHPSFVSTTFIYLFQANYSCSMIDQSLPHRQPVGTSVDLSGVVAK
jgi:hypothetical protein